MPKINFHTIPTKDKVEIYQQISNKTRMPPFAVEKDWWVVQALSAIFEMEDSKYLVFKGGTSLSKAWALIDRFSEDVDLAIDRTFFGFNGNLSRKQITELRKKASNYTSGVFLEELKRKFLEKGLDGVIFKLVETRESDQDPRIIEIYYPNVIKAPGYLEARVQIEIGCRSLKEPFTVQSIASLVDENYPAMEFSLPSIQVPTVNPERTFLEKIFLLHEEFQRPIEKIRVARLSRHLYDVVKLSKSEFAKKAFTDKNLYETIVLHRHTFNRLSGVDYNLHQTKTINPIPVHEVMEDWKIDYNKMIEEMIYEENPLSFQEIMDELMKIKVKINSLEWEFSNRFPYEINND